MDYKFIFFINYALLSSTIITPNLQLSAFTMVILTAVN